MTVLKLILFTLFILGTHCRRPDKVYCADEECEGPISKAKTLLTYNSADPDLVSFLGNSDALIYMKSAGTNSDLWFVKINGKSGFASSRFLREYKIIKKNPQVIVPYEPNIPESVQPDKVQQAHEVFEGTTIYTPETAVNNEQQDTTTESPATSSNENLTPSLDSTSAPPTESENIENTFIQDSIEPENTVVQDNIEAENTLINEPLEESSKPESHPEEKTSKDVRTTTELPEQEEASVITNDKNESVESEVDPIPDSSNNIVVEHAEESEQPIGQELPKKLPSEATTQQLLSSSSGTLNSEPLLEVPDKKEFNSVTDSEQIEGKEQNISTPNNNIENVSLDQDITSESNLPNGDTEPHNVPAVADPIPQPGIPPVSTDTIQEINQLNNADPNINNVHASDTVPQTEPLPNVPQEPPTSDTIPPVPETTTEQPVIPPIIEVMPPAVNPFETIPTMPPVTTETIPAFYPQHQNTPAPEPIPPILNLGQPILNVPASDEYPSTTPPFLYSDHTSYQQSASESTPPPDTYTTSENIDSIEQLQEQIPITEDTVTNENTEGFFSNVYSSVADMIPPSTEAPPPIYNTEDYPTYGSENVENNEGFSFMKYFISMYYSVMGTSEESKALFASVGETCYTDEYCDGTSNDGNSRLLTFLLTTASSVLLFTLGYYYIDNRRQDGRLIGQINSLQRDLLFTTKECEILKEELSTTKNKLAGIEDSSFGMDDMVQSLKEEINELKANNDRLRNSLDDNEKLLRVSENTAGELQNTLSEVENTLSELLAERANSEEQIVELNGKIQAFEEELISVSRDRDNFQLKYVSAESALEEFKKQKRHLEDVNQQLIDAKNSIELQKHEIDALKDVIKELKSGMPSNVDVSSLIDHTEIKAKLSKALEEKKSLETKYEAEHKEKSRLFEELQTTQETLHTTSQNATEALTRLDVLGKYFQERESELLKELSAKESLWLSKQGESASTVEKIEALQEEVQRFKEKCDALTLELAEQESARRSAVSAVEARAHAAWLDARAARRDADAARDDAAALRRKLAALSTLSTADGAISPHHKVASPLDGVENPVIPPPLPPMFLPPPLLPPLPRPPPLGRLPSPHPPRYGERRYTPDSRYSPESRYSPDSRYSPETVRYSPDSRYSPRSRRSPYSPRSRRRSRSRERYEDNRVARSRNGPADTETEYNSDSPSREPRRRGRYSRQSGPSSGSGCSSESDK